MLNSNRIQAEGPQGPDWGSAAVTWEPGASYAFRAIVWHPGTLSTYRAEAATDLEPSDAAVAAGVWSRVVDGRELVAARDAALSVANPYPVVAVVDIPGAHIPAWADAIRVSGYYTAGDGGGHLLTAISAPDTPVLGQYVSADGRWWQTEAREINALVYGVSETNTSASNDIVLDKLEQIKKIIYVPQGIYHLTNPMSRSYTTRYFGEGVLCFDTAEWVRRGGSSGSPDVPERYTLFYEYYSNSDVSINFNGVPQEFTWVGDYTIEASGDTSTTDLVSIRIANGIRRLSEIPQAIKSYNTFDSYAPGISPDHRAPPQAPVGYSNTYLGTQTPIAVTTGSNNVAVGSRAGRSITTAGNNTYIGFQAGYRSNGSGNTGVGSVVGEWDVSGYDNTWLGAGAGSHNVSGYQNTHIGRYAGSDCKIGYNNVSIGYRALANTGGDTPISSTVAVGAYAGDYAAGSANTLIGYRAGNGNSISDGGRQTFVGWFAGRNQSSGSAENTAIGAEALYSLTTGTANTALGTSALMSVTDGSSQTAVGYYALRATTTGTANVGVGREALAANQAGSYNTGVGYLALSAAEASACTAIGYRAGNALTTGQRLSAVGFEAGRFAQSANDVAFFGHRAGRATLANDNTAVGSDALLHNTTGTSNTAIGRLSLTTDVSGNNQTSYSNTTGVGSNTRVSGSNQVQLGDSTSAVYAQSAINVRSDARDKSDVRGTTLGLSFVLALRPVDYRWNMRDDYIVVDESGVCTRHENDGSKKRARYHHGLIAQEVKAVCDAHGVDFGGYQDHTINGGCDVKTLAYEELIAPIIKSIQEIYEKLSSLELSGK